VLLTPRSTDTALSAVGAFAFAFALAFNPSASARSTVVATEIFMWLTRIPRWAINALSTFRTVCLGPTESVVRRWISSTVPVGPATIRAATHPAAS
jgi:hypothetical protein